MFEVSFRNGNLKMKYNDSIVNWREISNLLFDYNNSYGKSYSLHPQIRPMIVCQNRKSDFVVYKQHSLFPQ